MVARSRRATTPVRRPAFTACVATATGGQVARPCGVRRDRLSTRRDVGIPRLAFEVLSPSSATYDREVKRTLLLEAGVEEVWLLDPQAEVIELWWPNAMRRFTGSDPAVSLALSGLCLTPARIFRAPS